MRRITVVFCACAIAFATAIGAVAGTAGARGSHHRARLSGARVSGLDKEYLKTSMEGDLFEVQGGKIALSHSHKPRGKAARPAAHP